MPVKQFKARSIWTANSNIFGSKVNEAITDLIANGNKIEDYKITMNDKQQCLCLILYSKHGAVTI